MSRRILVVGGAGYIGTVLTDHFLSAGHEVRVLDLFLYENNLCVVPYLANPRFSMVKGDMADPATIDRAMDGVTDVVLLAGLVGDPITKKFPEESAAINDRAVLNFIDAMNGRGLDRLVFVSTCSNYGLIEGDDLAAEDYPLNPLSLYAKSKVGAEKHVLASKGKVDYTPTVLRFATAFGLSPRMRFDLTVNEFTRDLAMGKDLLVFDAHTWRPYCHVRDFSRLIEMVLDAPEGKVGFEVFNAGGDVNNFTKQGIVDLILKHLPDAKVTYQEKGSDPRNYRVDFRKVRETLGFEPAYDVERGVTELLAAIGVGVFDRADVMRNLHGNYDLDYTPVSAS